MFGYLIRQIRKAKGMTQKQLANKCEFDICQISRTERGINDCTISTLMTIFTNLGTEPGDTLNEYYRQLNS